MQKPAVRWARRRAYAYYNPLFLPVASSPHAIALLFGSGIRSFPLCVLVQGFLILLAWQLAKSAQAVLRTNSIHCKQTTDHVPCACIGRERGNTAKLCSMSMAGHAY